MVADVSRRERRKRELRGRILEAARELFDEQGFHATKVAEIAERADVAHKTFFNHFPSKQHVVRELAEESIERLLADIDAVRRGGRSTRERLERFFGAVADNAREAGPMRRELLTELIHAVHESGHEPEQARRLHDAFEALVREGRAARDLTRRHSPETCAEMIMGAFYSLMFNWAHLEHYPIREQAAAAARFLADAMAHR